MSSGLAALLLEKALGPEDLCHAVIDCYQLSFSGTSGVEFLFPGQGGDGTFAHGHGHPSVALHVGMHSKSCINTPGNFPGIIECYH